MYLSTWGGGLRYLSPNMMQHNCSRKWLPEGSNRSGWPASGLAEFCCVYIPNGRTGDQARQSDDRQTEDAAQPRRHLATISSWRPTGTRHQDRRTDTVSSTVTDLSTDLHNNCGHRTQQGLDTRTVPAVLTALMRLYSQQPVQLQAQLCLRTFTVGQRPTDRIQRLPEHCSGCRELRKVAIHTDLTLDIGGVLRSYSRSTNITRTGHHDCLTML